MASTGPLDLLWTPPYRRRTDDDGRPDVQTTADRALDEALARIAELSSRLHAVSDLHAARRTVLRTRCCRACRQAWPCPTVRAVR